MRGTGVGVGVGVTLGVGDGVGVGVSGIQTVSIGLTPVFELTLLTVGLPNVGVVELPDINEIVPVGEI